MADYLRWKEAFSRDLMESGKKIILGGEKVLCIYDPGEHPECFYCKRIFVNTNVLINHMLMTRRNRDSGVGVFMGASFSQATCKIVTRTIQVSNDHSTLLPDKPMKQPFNPKAINWIGQYLGETEFGEDEILKTEPASERSLLNQISKLQPFNPNLFPNIENEILLFLAENEFPEGETQKNEPESNRSTLTPDMSDMRPFDHNFISNPSVAMEMNHAENYFGEGETLKTEPELY